jgi:hypothetical protein
MSALFYRDFEPEDLPVPNKQVQIYQFTYKIAPASQYRSNPKDYRTADFAAAC